MIDLLTRFASVLFHAIKHRAEALKSLDLREVTHTAPKVLPAQARLARECEIDMLSSEIDLSLCNLCTRFQK